jgi:HK97 family phage prohead protease
MTHEIRSLKGELRAAADFTLQGLAARFGTRSADLGGFIETIAPSAFTRSLAAGDRVVITVNHDPNQVLGNTKSGTAKVWADDTGLRFSVKLDPTNTVHTNCYASVKRGDLDSCSFAFRVPKGGDSLKPDVDSNGKPIVLRTLTDVDLVDASVVCYPAYPEGTAVDARSLKSKGLLRVAIPSVDSTVLLQASDAARRSAARVQATKIDDAARKEKAARLGAVIATDAAQEEHRQKINRILGKDEISPAKFVTDLERRATGGGGLIYPYENLASAVSAQLPGHKLVGANSSQAFTKHSSGSKYTVPYSENNGKFSFGQASLGGHPEWLTDKDVS